MKKRTRKAKPARLDKAGTAEPKTRIVARFRDDGRCRMMGSYPSGATLSLQEGKSETLIRGRQEPGFQWDAWLCSICHKYHQGERPQLLDLRQLDRMLTGLTSLSERGISAYPSTREKSGDRLCACCQRTPVGMFYRYTLSNPEFRSPKEER